MSCSPAKLAACRANGSRSRGPVTAEGKATSRANAVKHGLSGAGVALPNELAAEVEARSAAFVAELAPRTELDRHLVQRLALATVRMERAAVQETAALSARIRSAEADFEESRAALVDQLVAQLETNPAAAVRRLKRMPEGIEYLDTAWSDLRGELTEPTGPRWSLEHARRMDNLGGRQNGLFGRSKAMRLSEALIQAQADQKPPLAAQLVALIDAELNALAEAFERIDFATIDQDRAEAPSRALFDASREACLARRYEAAALREQNQILEQLTPPPADATPEPAQPSAPVGSFRGKKPPRSAATPKTPSQTANPTQPPQSNPPGVPTGAQTSAMSEPRTPAPAI